jgi:type IV pilus assembly protein PilW
MKRFATADAPALQARPVPSKARRAQRGLTLVELMVAVVLGLLIVGAAVAALIIARQGFRTVDGSTQLRENARFAASLIQRVAVQAGFENVAYGQITDKAPGIRGYDNALLPSLPSLPAGLASGSRTAATCSPYADTSCINGSDLLVLRYEGVSRAGSVLPGQADGTMINCAGVAEPEATGADARAYSIFHVQRSATGEPTLACTYREPVTLAWKTIGLVQGVEGFRVVYGTDGVTPNVCAADVGTGADSVAERYLTATQLDSASGTYCANNWARVRGIRVGLLIRGAAADGVVRVAKSWQVLSVPGADYPFGTALSVPADGRPRQQMVFTIHLRNAQHAP